MSHVALRRAAICLLYDPALAAAVATDPERALAALELTVEERHLLAAVPPAAWSADPDRGTRLIAALADEFPASLALAPDRAGGFVSSAAFRRVVRERGSMAAAFGEHLAADPRAGDVARLEGAVAAVRRAPRRAGASPPGHLRLAPHARVLAVRGGTTGRLEALRRGTPASAAGDAPETILVVRDGRSGEVTMEELSDALAAVLTRALDGAPIPLLTATLAGFGASPDEAAATLATLRADGVLV
jgi:hypothetical protein